MERLLAVLGTSAKTCSNLHFPQTVKNYVRLTTCAVGTFPSEVESGAGELLQDVYFPIAELV